MDEEEDPMAQALAKVKKASAEHEHALANEKTKRDSHHAAIVEALKAGAGPSAIERNSHYDRQHVDRIRRAADIPPKRKATVQRIPKEQ